MIALESAFIQIGILFAVAGVGLISSKLGYLDGTMKDKLTSLMLNVTVPCMIISSANGIDISLLENQLTWAVALALVMFVVAFVTGLLCNLILRTPKKERRTYLFMSYFTNVTFLGIPVIETVYGNEMILVTCIFVAVLNMFVYTIGFMVVSPESSNVKAILKIVSSPLTISSLIAIIVLFTGFHMPALIEGSLETIGSLTSPLAMMLMGVVIYNMNIISALREWRLFPFVIIRQLILPIGTYMAFTQLPVDPTMAGMVTIELTMPVGVITPMVLGQMGYDQTLPTQGTLVSTLASLAIIPLVVLATTLI